VRKALRDLLHRHASFLPSLYKPHVVATRTLTTHADDRTSKLYRAHRCALQAFQVAHMQGDPMSQGKVWKALTFVRAPSVPWPP
jgi:hypothetical protein